MAYPDLDLGLDLGIDLDLGLVKPYGYYFLDKPRVIELKKGEKNNNLREKTKQKRKLVRYGFLHWRCGS